MTSGTSAQTQRATSDSVLSTAGTSSSPSSSPQPPSVGRHSSHPGTIPLPPPPPISAFPALGTLSPHLMSGPHGPPMMTPPHHYQLSPMHHPGQHQHQHQHGGMMMTPGLPPITPSMPSFTFFPQMSPHLPSPSVAPGSPGGPMMGMHPHGHHPNPFFAGVSPAAAMGPPTPMGVLSPGLPFSPGVALTPGNFWGAGANAYINPAVGAPVHRPPEEEGAGAGQSQEGGYFPPVQYTSSASGSGGRTEAGSVSGSQQLLEPSQEQGYFPPVTGLGRGREGEGITRNQSGGSSTSEGTPSSSRDGPSPVSTTTTSWYDDAQSTLLAKGFESLAVDERDRGKDDNGLKTRTYSAGSGAAGAGRPNTLAEKGRSGSDPAPAHGQGAGNGHHQHTAGSYGVGMDMGGTESAPPTMQRPEDVVAASPFRGLGTDYGAAQQKQQQQAPWGTMEHMRSH
ncbi:hypothetical protein PUNSTDRAFT_114003 [Punctularia strigosozonata HHB-11173 SS5]|uniref:uncharacterized protein n=1 Tax=Punctularia strigosozonata (strain HHB-11173) TaxID=741275 RepID=UPI00044165E0|nr:uncharacterized protein PUNSTDRAFT_114003 [Punctularia strigosozonata HHB-11173 SS5]EIN08500.1 hypothetical protein PUNSTDRAFT_114003 [Punctularia strigosozonata HHB-11173 SS5]